MPTAKPPSPGEPRPHATPIIPTLLIAGPSNAGKTPVGDALQQRGPRPRGHACHLDFGEHLRQSCAGTINPGFSREERALIRTFLQGRLLDEATFFVAERIVRWFLAHKNVDPAHDVLVLNGLPRHQGQAHSLAAIGVDIRCVLELQCSAETAWRRKQRSESGTGFEERGGRDDGSREIFLRKAASYVADTLPLIEHFRGRGTPIVTVAVGVDTAPAEVVSTFSAAVTAQWRIGTWR